MQENKMKISIRKLLIPALLAVLATVHAAHAQDRQPRTNSAKGSPTSDTRASRALSACDAAIGELAASRTLIDALDDENAALKSRLATERQTAGILNELNETRRGESAALREALMAKTETIAAKDSVIVAQEKLIGTLKIRPTSIWKRVGDVMLGAAAALVLK